MTSQEEVPDQPELLPQPHDAETRRNSRFFLGWTEKLLEDEENRFFLLALFQLVVPASSAET